MTTVATLYVQHGAGGIEYRLERADSEATGPLRQVVSRPVLEHELAALQRSAATVLGSAPHPGFTDYARMRGAALFQTLVPDELRADLAALADPLLICTSVYGLPFELFYDTEFWGVRHALGKQLLTERAPRRVSTADRPGRARVLVISSDPRGDLGHVHLEAERIFASWEPFADAFLIADAEASFDGVINRLGAGYDVIHYCGHVVAGADHVTGLLLADERVLTGAIIERILNGSPLVFLNGCTSVRSAAHVAARTWESEIAPLTQGFLIGGARAVVGTSSEVGDAEAGAIAVDFYRRVIDGAAIGEALRGARQYGRSIAPYSPSWLSFVLYGNPGAVLLADTSVPRRRTGADAPPVPEGNGPRPWSRRVGIAVAATAAVLLFLIAAALLGYRLPTPRQHAATEGGSGRVESPIGSRREREKAPATIAMVNAGHPVAAPPAASAVAFSPDYARQAARRAFVLGEEPDFTKLPELFVGPTPAAFFVRADVGNPTAPYDLHVVCVYKGPAPRVTVDGVPMANAIRVTVRANPRPVVLFLMSYEHVAWQIEAEPGARISAVYYSSYEASTAKVPEGAPEPIRVAEHLYTYDYRSPDDGDHGAGASVLRRIGELVGLPVTSFQGSNTGEAFVVPNYRDPAAFAPIVAAYGDLLRERTAQPSGAYWLVNGGSITHMNGGEEDVNRRLSVSRDVKGVAYDADDDRFYAVTDQELFEIDARSGRVESVKPPEQYPRLSWLGGVAYDADLHRVLITTKWHTGVHYAFAPGTGEWRVFPIERAGGGLDAITYDRQTNTVYGLSGRGLSILDPNFNKLRDVPLSDLGALNLDESRGPAWAAQMVTIENGLLVCSEADTRGSGRHAAQRCFVVSIPAGEMKLARFDG